MQIKSLHVIQPYWVGTKDRKSLAMIIPAQVVKDQNLDTSTILMMRVSNNANIILKVIDTKYKDKEDMVTSAGESLDPSGQQMSSGTQ
jgi:antitoxin component of MazEF toxin-antitoxin module